MNGDPVTPLSEETMPAATLEALRGSIAKWEAIVSGTGTDEGAENCALCRLFHTDYREDGGLGCHGCPVRARTGRPLCMGSPYDDCHESPTEEQAQAELDFLKSLLPPEVA